MAFLIVPNRNCKLVTNTTHKVSQLLKGTLGHASKSTQPPTGISISGLYSQFFYS